MKILQLGKFYPIEGGVEKVMHELTLGLSKRKVHCDMMCTSINGEASDLEINEYGSIIRCKSLFKVAATTISPQMIVKLRKVCNNYDIIHVHHPDPMAALALFLSGYKGEVILHWHSDIFKQKRLLKLYKPLQNWLIKRASQIVGTTPVYVKESPHLQEAQDKTTYIPIGIDKLKPSEEEALKIRSKYPNKKIVFSVGRLVEYKGYTHLIDAARYLSDEYVVLIAGSGPLKDELQNQIESLGLSDKVKLLGFISNEMKNAHFEASDLFCLSSIQKSEAFAIVQIEAMSCGKPVVATNIPGSGVPWVNMHEVSGLNVTPENGFELAEAITSICNNEDTYLEFSKRAEARYHFLFTKSEMIDKCLSVYENIIDESEVRKYNIPAQEIHQEVV